MNLSNSFIYSYFLMKLWQDLTIPEAEEILKEVLQEEIVGEVSMMIPEAEGILAGVSAGIIVLR